MIQKKIRPYLIDENRLVGYYELLLEDGFEVKIFSKKKDEELYKYFMPVVKDYLLWTFNLDTSEKIKEFKSLSNDLKAAVCARFKCNIFVNKKKETVICFNTGICFAITDDDELFETLTKYAKGQEMNEINLRNEAFYEFKDEKEEHQFAQILELYKIIYLNKINNQMKDGNSFDKVRKSFVQFTQDVYAISETDQDDFCENLQNELNIEKLYIVVENQFDLLYKNNKLNDNMNTKRFIIVLLIVCIIIGIINLMC